MQFNHREVEGECVMRKIMQYCFPIIILLAACTGEESSLSQSTVESSSSYQALLNVYGDEYLSRFDDIGDYQIDKEIGVVEKKISVELYPYNSFESNYLEEGTKLYSVKYSNDLLLAEIEPGIYELFSR